MNRRLDGWFVWLVNIWVNGRVEMDEQIEMDDGRDRMDGLVIFKDGLVR